MIKWCSPILDNGGIREAFLAYKKRLASKGMEPSLPGLHGFTLDQASILVFIQKIEEHMETLLSCKSL